MESLVIESALIIFLVVLYWLSGVVLGGNQQAASILTTVIHGQDSKFEVPGGDSEMSKVPDQLSVPLGNLAVWIDPIGNVFVFNSDVKY